MEGAMMTDMEMEESARDKMWQASVVERLNNEVIGSSLGSQAVRSPANGSEGGCPERVRRFKICADWFSRSEDAFYLMKHAFYLSEDSSCGNTASTKGRIDAFGRS